MIGNDIIDLAAAKKESNWRREGYLKKLFSIEEQDYIKESTTPDSSVWSLWSMKEAVYKAEFRRTLHYEYAPLKIRCIKMNQEDNMLKCELLYNDIKYFTFTKILSNYLHTIACRWKKDFTYLKIIVVKDYPENYSVYLKKNKLLSSSEFIIKSDCGIPNLINIEKEKIYPMSISHHGRFLATVSIPYYSI
jgi:phosphopantetheinyl transferase (holo-ACP synthase)